MGTREQEEGKARVAAQTVWVLKLPGVEFRCVRTTQGTVALDAKRAGARWTRTAHRKTARELLEYVTRTTAPMLDRETPPEGAPEIIEPQPAKIDGVTYPNHD